MTQRSEWTPLFMAVRQAGWRLRPAKHGYRCYPRDPALAPIALGGTPSDWRAVRNSAAALRRAGLAV